VTPDPDDPTIRRLMAVGKTVAARSNGSGFLQWVRDQTDLTIASGDENWEAVDVSDGRRVVARVFPKRGLVKVRGVGTESNDYGSEATLNSRKEWVFELDSPRFEMDQLHRCLSDQTGG
jgi:hypothetical protein